MATPVSWRFGPWATGGQSPYSTISTPNAAPVAPASGYDEISPSGGGIGGPGITGTAEYGPMTASQLGGMWGGTALGKLGSLGINAAIAGHMPSIGISSFYGMAPKAGVTLASLLSSLFGGVRGIDESFGVPTEADIQNARDMQGAFAARDLESQRSAFDASRSFGVETPTGPLGPASPAPGMQNPDIDTTQPGWGSNQRSMDVGGGEHGAESGGNPGGGVGAGGMGDAGGTEALGGVHTTKPGKSMTSTWGELGQPETAIFIPHAMTKPGIQGQEKEVRAALKKFMQALK